MMTNTTAQADVYYALFSRIGLSREKTDALCQWVECECNCSDCNDEDYAEYEKEFLS